MQLFRFSESSTRHTCKLLIQAEVVLEGDSGKRMVLALYFNALFGLNRLVQALAIATSWHLAACELIDDYHFPVFDDIVFVALEDDLRLNGVLHVACQVKIVFIEDIL